MTPRQIVVKLLQKTKLNRLAHQLYYDHIHGFNSASNSTTKGIELAFEHAARLGTLTKGDYYEFGLFKGYSFWRAHKSASQYNATKLRFFGFDSFEGLPEVYGIDLIDSDDFYRGQYACSYERVSESLDQKGIDWNRTFLTKGFYNESLTHEIRKELNMDKIAIALIDCDLYSSTVDVLNFINPMIMDKTILIFDDWNCFDRDNERGQRMAYLEFAKQRPEIQAEPVFSYGSWGQAFLLHDCGTPA
jgi:hypothetical protein